MALYLNQKQLAERWNCSEATIHNRRKAGLIPFFRLPGTTIARYPIKDIERLEKEYLVKEVVPTALLTTSANKKVRLM